MTEHGGIGEASEALATSAAALAAEVSRPLEGSNYLDLVRTARRIRELSDVVLVRCVEQCREAGHTWQEIGDLLGVTRQAAFQRFGKPIDPRTGAPMDKAIHMTNAPERARAIVEQVLEGRMDLARTTFNSQVLEAFTDEVRANGLATVAGMVGAFERIDDEEPFTRRIGDHTVVDIPLVYEAGEMKARVAFDSDEKVAGLVIVPPGTP